MLTELESPVANTNLEPSPARMTALNNLFFCNILRCKGPTCAMSLLKHFASLKKFELVAHTKKKASGERNENILSF